MFAIKPLRPLAAILDRRSQKPWSSPSDLLLKSALDESVRERPADRFYKMLIYMTNAETDLIAADEQVAFLPCLLYPASLDSPSGKGSNRLLKYPADSCQIRHQQFFAAAAPDLKRQTSFRSGAVSAAFLHKFNRSVVQDLHCTAQNKINSIPPSVRVFEIPWSLGGTTYLANSSH